MVWWVLMWICWVRLWVRLSEATLPVCRCTHEGVLPRSRVWGVVRIWRCRLRRIVCVCLGGWWVGYRACIGWRGSVRVPTLVGLLVNIIDALSGAAGGRFWSRVCLSSSSRLCARFAMRSGLIGKQSLIKDFRLTDWKSCGWSSETYSLRLETVKNSETPRSDALLTSRYQLSCK